MTDKKEKAKEEFMDLWEIGMHFFKANDPHWKFRFCEKAGVPVSFDQLVNNECWNCPNYINNDGNCDCI